MFEDEDEYISEDEKRNAKKINIIIGGILLTIICASIALLYYITHYNKPDNIKNKSIQKIEIKDEIRKEEPVKEIEIPIVNKAKEILNSKPNVKLKEDDLFNQKSDEEEIQAFLNKPLVEPNIEKTKEDPTIDSNMLNEDNINYEEDKDAVLAELKEIMDRDIPMKKKPDIKNLFKKVKAKNIEVHNDVKIDTTKKDHIKLLFLNDSGRKVHQRFEFYPMYKEKMEKFVSLDEGMYTINLATFGDYNNALRYIRSEGIIDDAYFFYFDSNKRPMFKILYGAYQSKNEAKLMIKQFPSSLKSNKPGVSKIGRYQDLYIKYNYLDNQ